MQTPPTGAFLGSRRMLTQGVICALFNCRAGRVNEPGAVEPRKHGQRRSLKGRGAEIMKQRDLLRALFVRHGDKEETLVREYAAAERRGEVRRASNQYDRSPEEYARALLADARKKGWVTGLN